MIIGLFQITGSSSHLSYNILLSFLGTMFNLFKKKSFQIMLFYYYQAIEDDLIIF